MFYNKDKTGTGILNMYKSKNKPERRSKSEKCTYNNRPLNSIRIYLK